MEKVEKVEKRKVLDRSLHMSWFLASVLGGNLSATTFPEAKNVIAWPFVMSMDVAAEDVAAYLGVLGGTTRFYKGVHRFTGV